MRECAPKVRETHFFRLANFTIEMRRSPAEGASKLQTGSAAQTFPRRDSQGPTAVLSSLGHGTSQKS